MTQRHFAGGAAVAERYAGAQIIRRRFRGDTLVWEHPNFPTLDFTGGALPSPSSVPSAGKYQVTYLRTGVAYAWAAGSPEPSLVQIAADTPRFTVCPPGVDHSIVGQAMGILFEPTRTNILPYGRGAVTGWTSTNITPTTGSLGFYASGTSRILTAGAANGIHYRTTPPASQTANWCFSAWVKRVTGTGRVFLTLKSGVEIDISEALANYYIDGSGNRQPAWARVWLAIPELGPWYGDINTCARIGFRIETSGDAIAVDAIQLEAGDYPTSEILNAGAGTSIRYADRLLIDINVGGTATRRVLDANDWEADTSTAALLWRSRQERHIKRIQIEPNGGNWDIALQTPAENRPNVVYHDGAPSPVLYAISQPEGIPLRDQVYPEGYVIEAAAFGNVGIGNIAQYARFDGSSNYVAIAGTNLYGSAAATAFVCGFLKLPGGYASAADEYLTSGASNFSGIFFNSLARLNVLFRGTSGGLGTGGSPYHAMAGGYSGQTGITIAFMVDIAITGSTGNYTITPRGRIKIGKAAAAINFSSLTPTTGSSQSQITTSASFNIGAGNGGSNKIDIDCGAIWLALGRTIDASSDAAWQEFFGTGSQNAGTAISPQFLTADGSFGANATPPLFMDWLAHDGKVIADNKGTAGGTPTVTGTPTYGAWDFSA